MNILEGLNPAQRQAVEAPEGPLLVVAGPGSGKTRVLTHRVAYLVKERGVKPYHLLAVTFTNKAAREMKERLFQLLGPGLREITIGTFHATCVRILRRESERAGVERNFVIYDENDQANLVAEALDELGFDKKTYRPRAFLAAISHAKCELVPPSAFPSPTYWHEIAGRVYHRYQELLATNNALDFDDLLTKMVDLFRDEEDVLDKYRRRYQHLLVDEFQDTNMVQYELVKLLTLEHRNLFVVGDEDQSIYTWRGADFRNVRRFRKDFPEAKIILLEQNYRSTQNILDAAHAVISKNEARVEKRLWTEKEGGLPLTIIEAYDEEEEAQYVLGETQRLEARGVCDLGDCAVMYRTNAQSRALEDAFVRAGVPYRLVGATRFYERREVKDIIAYLRLVHNPYDALSLLRIINVPRRAIGKRSLEQLMGWSNRLGVPIYTALGRLSVQEPEEAPFHPRSKRILSEFANLLEELIDGGQRLDLLELFDLVLERTGYAEYIRDGTEQGEERWNNVMELRSVASEYADLAPEVGLTTFLEEVALVSDVDNYDERANAPTFLTLHMAKGLEFPVVFIVGLEEGVLPHSRSFDDREAMEEERRLCYVGITRAKERLYLIHTFRRTLRGLSQVNSPSRFLLDIPPQLVRGSTESVQDPEYPSLARRAPRRAGSEGYERATRLLRDPAALEVRQFNPGDKVRHPQFGEGVVVSSKLVGDDEEVVVAFVGMKPKRLLVSFAQMEKLLPTRG